MVLKLATDLLREASLEEDKITWYSNETGQFQCKACGLEEDKIT